MPNGRWSIVIATVSLLAGAGCGSDADAPAPVVRLCDGSANLTLRIFFSGGGQEVPGSEVRRENGYPSFAVDGQCQYFMSGDWLEQRQGRDLGWRQGLVDDELRRTLEAKAGAEDLKGTYDDCGSGSPIPDAPAAIVANARSSMTCSGDGSAGVGAVFAVIRQHARQLWTDGQPLDGDLRITVRELSGSNSPPYRWPSGLALGDYFEPDWAKLLPGTSKLVTAADAVPFRALREQYLHDTEPGILYTTEGIPVTDGEMSATMFMRDALPYEDERGLLPLPGQ
jgi:hypothetical protein